MKSINLSGKVIAQLPCNNGRELLSLLKFGAVKGIGFDISDTAIREAKELASISKLNATFIRTDILEINPKYNNTFDFIYISEGSLQWFPSVTEYFKVVSRLLKKNGKILIYEIHPFAYLLEQVPELKSEVTLNDLMSYFKKGPYSYKTGMDYVGQKSYKAKKCYWYIHKISDIQNAIIQNDIEINEFNEYNQEMANNQSIKALEKFPLSYILLGTKQ